MIVENQKRQSENNLRARLPSAISRTRLVTSYTLQGRSARSLIHRDVLSRLTQ